jgi:hypothetical protein
MWSHPVIQRDDGTPMRPTFARSFLRGIPRPGVRFIYEVVERARRDVFHCSIAVSTDDRWLEIPAWVFDRAVCGMVRVDGTPPRRYWRAGCPSEAAAGSAADFSYVGFRRSIGLSRLHREGLHAAQAHDVSVRSVLQTCDFGIAQTPRWRTLPAPTRQTLTPLIVRLLLDHADSDPVTACKKMRDVL